MTPKHAACFLSVKCDLMAKMLHEYVFDMQLFKKSEFGWVGKQYLQLNIKGCCMLCLKENNPFYWRDELFSFFSENLNKISKIVTFDQKKFFLSKKFKIMHFAHFYVIFFEKKY